jgi:hypothetical protein
MDIEDIDSWYDEEKEKLSEKYLIRLKKADGIKDESKRRRKHDLLAKEYTLHLKRLNDSYSSSSGKTLDKDLKKFFFWHKIKMRLKQLFKRKKE